ncbi:Flp family type IVb pilin [Kordiimonas marina]|uniref:Flp family type IVb pilin n=1 Tax=Kordiimonas marina TaxID=2872312 RepID=UPI001FF543B2|nr:Flp family type IVb pilin [Kordiimonas marina]MCJ9428590.1 Flp family type IVb pilin [Kordiimonas marina]
MTKFLTKFRRNEEGATAIEYGLIAALVAIALITALNSLSGGLQGVFNKTATSLNTASGTTTTP